MVRHVLAALVALAAFPMPHAEASDRDEAVRGPVGVPVGRVRPLPDGSVEVQDRVGVKVGTVRTLPDGRTVFQDRIGVTQGTVPKQALDAMGAKGKR